MGDDRVLTAQQCEAILAKRACDACLGSLDNSKYPMGVYVPVVNVKGRLCNACEDLWLGDSEYSMLGLVEFIELRRAQLDIDI